LVQQHAAACRSAGGNWNTDEESSKGPTAAAKTIKVVAGVMVAFLKQVKAG
jgi:hypothetical protein